MMNCSSGSGGSHAGGGVFGCNVFLGAPAGGGMYGIKRGAFGSRVTERRTVLRESSSVVPGGGTERPWGLVSTLHGTAEAYAYQCMSMQEKT